MKLHYSLLLFILQDSACQDWSFSFPETIVALKSSCVEIPCTLTHPPDYGEFNLIWFSYAKYSYPQIFNKANPSSVLQEYKGRTFLVGNSKNSCSLRMNNVMSEDYYFPGINDQINSWVLHNKKMVTIKVADSVGEQQLIMPENLIEGTTANISCFVEHTCASNPPSVEWNKVGQVSTKHEHLHGGNWKVVAEMRYVPTFEDYNTKLECTATYLNGKKTQKTATLDIKYAPRNTKIAIPENTFIKEGDNVTLKCSSQSNPAVNKYIWYEVGSHANAVLQEHADAISLHNVSWENRHYSCSTINEVGTGDTVIIEIPVHYSAKDVHVELEQYEGSDSITLICTFSRSNPEPTYFTWYKNGILIANKSSQTLFLPDKTQHVTYSCVVHNAVGNSSSLLFNVAEKAEEPQNNMTAILGSVAGLIIIILLMLVLYIYLRWRWAKKSASPENRSIENNFYLPTSVPEDIPMDDHLYGNVQPEPYNSHTDIDSTSIPNPDYINFNLDPRYSKHREEGNEEILYTAVEHNHPKRVTQDLSHVEETEYVILKL